MAEAMSGFAAINGEPDGAAAAPADRAHRRGRRARRRVRGDGRAAPSRSHRRGPGHRREPARVDAADDVGRCRRPPRTSATSSRGSARASRTPCPRGTYRCADGEWVAISTSAESVAHARARRSSASATTRASHTFAGRAGHRDELDGSRRRVDRGAAPSAEVLAAFDAAEAAIAPVYTMGDLLADPHVGSAARVRRGRRGGDAGAGRAPQPHSGRITGPGRPLGADTERSSVPGNSSPRGG